MVFFLAAAWGFSLFQTISSSDAPFDWTKWEGDRLLVASLDRSKDRSWLHVHSVLPEGSDVGTIFQHQTSGRFTDAILCDDRVVVGVRPNSDQPHNRLEAIARDTGESLWFFKQRYHYPTNIQRSLNGKTLLCLYEYYPDAYWYLPAPTIVAEHDIETGKLRQRHNYCRKTDWGCSAVRSFALLEASSQIAIVEPAQVLFHDWPGFRLEHTLDVPFAGSDCKGRSAGFVDVRGRLAAFAIGGPAVVGWQTSKCPIMLVDLFERKVEGVLDFFEKMPSQLTAFAVIDERLIITGHMDGAIAIWDVSAGELVATAKGTGIAVFHISCHATQPIIATVDRGLREVRVYRVRKAGAAEKAETQGSWGSLWCD